MNVLSLFDGKAWAYAALTSLWIKIDKYFASEVDKYPIQIAKKNFPDIIHIGDVKDIWYSDGTLVSGWFTLPHQIYDWYCWLDVNIDLLIGGSPCQDLSIAKKWWKWLEWEKSSLFWEYVRVLWEVRPKYFILENVASMKSEERDKMTKALTEIYPDTTIHMIDSCLVTAQNRKRYYWTNIKWIEQPDDRKIMLRDILEDIPFDWTPDSKDSIWKPLDEKYLNNENRLKLREKSLAIQASYHKKNAQNYFLKWEWQMIVWRLRGKDNLRIHADQDKCMTLTSHLGTWWNNVPIILGIYQIPRWKNHWWIVANWEKAPTLTTGLYEHNNKLMADADDMYFYRKLTCIECERLQGYDDNYTEWVSASRRYQMIWNWFNKPTIAHILSYMK